MNAPATRSAPPTRDELAAGFDAFYKEARARLLLQTFALTGDLGASRSAVRDAFVTAWHHWRTLHRLDTPEMEVRPHAWRIASRRTTAKPWGRAKNLAPEAQATLDALGTLSTAQRSALLLTQLAAVSMDEMAREIGLPLEAAEKELQSAAARFATERSIPTSAIPVLLAGLAGETDGVSWPRVTIIRRAGAARRRAHTVLGATAAVVALVGAGAIVTDATGARPVLARVPTTPATTAPVEPPAQVSLPDTALLPDFEVSGELAGRWRVQRTNDNSTGNGLVHPCQSDRYADPRGVAAWARVYRMTDESSSRRFVQTAEASANPKRAERAYERAVEWFAGCMPPENGDATDLPHTQLISTARAVGVGEDASVLILRDTEPDATHLVGVARTGNFVTVTSLRTEVAPARADRQGIADLLGAAVQRLCGLPDGGGCAEPPVEVRDIDAYPVGRSTALLADIDLPPVGLDQGSLVGTRARKVTGDRGGVTVVGCNAVRLLGSYGRTEIRTNLYRSFVFVDSDLPDTTGLGEVVGSLPNRRAEAFVAQMRNQITGCPDQDASVGTEVTPLFNGQDGNRSVSAWRLETEIGEDETISYDVAVVRRGTAVAQVVYVAAPGAEMTDDEFVALAFRAQERLRQLPPYRGSD